MSRPVDNPPHILLYIPNARLATKLAETLGEHAFTVTTAADEMQVAAALSHNRYTAIVTGTLHVGEVRKKAIHPVINYEVFVHNRPQETDPQSGARSYFDVDDFIRRVRFHVAAPA